MTEAPKRDNSYWLGRLEKDGHVSLLERVSAGEITVYKATQEAGYRSRGPSKPAAKLSHHWVRASHGERKRFVAAHLLEINRVLRDTAADIQAAKAKKAKT